LPPRPAGRGGPDAGGGGRPHPGGAGDPGRPGGRPRGGAALRHPGLPARAAGLSRRGPGGEPRNPRAGPAVSQAGVFVFTGPTLPVEEGRTILDDAVYLPPASQGDVYRAARERPWGIAIVDGYFGRVPAVWHKEILWALAQGVHVFG